MKLLWNTRWHSVKWVLPLFYLTSLVVVPEMRQSREFFCFVTDCVLEFRGLRLFPL